MLRSQTRTTTATAALVGEQPELTLQAESDASGSASGRQSWQQVRAVRVGTP